MSAGGVIEDGKAPPWDAPAEALMEKLTYEAAAPTLAQPLEQFIVKAR